MPGAGNRSLGAIGPRLVAAKTAGETSGAAPFTGIRASFEESPEVERDPRVGDMPASDDVGRRFCPAGKDMRSSLNIFTL
jgi:hypothetical protein